MLKQPELRLGTPIGDHVLVKIPEAESITNGGIIIPESARDTQTEAGMCALVVAVGETACLGNDVFPEKGEWVLISKYAGKTFQGFDEAEHRIINGGDVLSTLEVTA